MHEEKLLAMICRVNEKEAVSEIGYLEAYISNLNSKHDNYNLFESKRSK